MIFLFRCLKPVVFNFLLEQQLYNFICISGKFLLELLHNCGEVRLFSNDEVRKFILVDKH